MEAELRELKSVLRSIVVSSSVRVDLRGLLRDYKNMTGESMPLAKFGYRDPLAFFKERCSDCFLLSGPSSNPTLTLIVPDTLKHIDDFVQKQRGPAGLKSVGKRRSVPGHAHNISSEYNRDRNPQDLIYKTFIARNDTSRRSTGGSNIDDDEPSARDARSGPPRENGTKAIGEGVARLAADGPRATSPGAAAAAPDARRLLRRRLIMYHSSQRLDRDAPAGPSGAARAGETAESRREAAEPAGSRGSEPPPGTGAAARAPPDADDALPGIPYDPAVFPPECMHYEESIRPLGLGDAAVGAMLEVVVGEVYSPSHFWLLRLGERFDAAMERAMDEMGEFYGRGAGRRLRLPPGAARPGQYCASLFERDWHRSLVVAAVDADTVKVRHVDYGTVDAVRRDSLKPLRREWAEPPAQAVRARLAGVRPAAGALRWPHAAAAHFLQLVRDVRLVANVVALDAEEETLEVFLVDTRGEDDVCMSRELIRAGHADPRRESSLRAPDLHLFPTFAALESGSTPNFGELARYLADGICPDYVESYRRHVPAAWPPCRRLVPARSLRGISPPPGFPRL